MGYIQIYHKMPAKRAIRALQKAVEESEVSETAKRRKRAIEHYERFGLASTLDAYEIRRAAFYNWQKKYHEFGISALTDGSRCPHKKRDSKVANEVKEKVFKYRSEHKGVGKEYIKPELDKFCDENGYDIISVSTIGRILKQLKEEGRIESRKQLSLNARSGKIKEIKKTIKNKERRKGLKAKEPGDIVQIDSVHLTENAVKRYFITAIDVFGRQGYVREYKTLNSDNAKDFMTNLQRTFAYKIKRVQTDNGLEFYKHFDEYLRKENITHFWNYPRSPKSNAYIERFNRTLREQFMNVYEGDLTDIETAESELKDYLFWYNTQKVHKGLNWQTPTDFTNQFFNQAAQRFIQKSNMY
jgi:transposase InsO family protein